MDVNATPGPDDRDLDEGGLDLSPRTDAVGARRNTASRRYGAIAVLVALVGVIGVVAWQARDATVFFKNADEAVAEKASLGSQNFRLQGTVVGAPDLRPGNEPSRFTVAYNDVEVDVVHTGSEPALFKAGLPVVVEGSWNSAGNAFDSNRILVKHTEDYQEKDDGEYEEENPDRVTEEQATS